jgi:hypothetical protein
LVEQYVAATTELTFKALMSDQREVDTSLRSK